jgi:putative nucleotidyltransferase with HDIG domain
MNREALRKDATPDQIVDEILSLLAGPAGQETYGEGVTQLEHALECAMFAAESTDDDEMIVAALLHDIGHICDPDAEQMGGVGAHDHEGIGAAYLTACGFSEKVVQTVSDHVAAKRYLVATRPEYAAELSPASRETLRYQGGPMTPDEALAFEQAPYFVEKLQLRSWDEMGKRPDAALSPLESYRPLLLRHLQQQTSA